MPEQRWAPEPPHPYHQPQEHHPSQGSDRHRGSPPVLVLKRHHEAGGTQQQDHGHRSVHQRRGPGIQDAATAGAGVLAVQEQPLVAVEQEGTRQDSPVHSAPVDEVPNKGQSGLGKQDGKLG